ncbi:MAG: selenium-binding family protein [Gemmataceae bacterium]|nr:selenium-binding family protein [Gemmataceae bacterium]MDW8241997.1 selenium-binding family protein [Thermogemmata sp.]
MRGSWLEGVGHSVAEGVAIVDRRTFLSSGLAAASLWVGGHRVPAAQGPALSTPGYASPQQAMQAPREKLLFVACTYVGTSVHQPDYLAVVDVDPASTRYGQVIYRLSMPKVGDELHHYGWNICSSCHGRPGDRRYLIVPGFRSSRIHIIDAKEPTSLRLHAVIEPEEVAKVANLSAPHTVHCLPSGEVMISMLGDAQGNGPGGFLLLDEQFRLKGRWEKEAAGMQFNYDFWYQPRYNVMVSTEWAAPRTFGPGPRLEDVAAGKYGRHLHFWDWQQRRLIHSVDLGQGAIPLEVRFAHDPDKDYGFVGAALSSSIWLFRREGSAGQWQARKVIQLEPVKKDDFPGGQVPPLISDILISMDDRFLYVSTWLHGRVLQYDIRDPERPKLTGSVAFGGLIGPPRQLQGRELSGGPQMLQLSLDGRRLYVTNSLYSSWDNAFYPQIAKQGSWLVQLDCDPQQGGMQLNEKFLVDFGKEPQGPARAHEIRYPGGDCSSDIFS